MSEEEQGPRIEVWEVAPGAWRWRYLLGEPESEEGLALASNASEASREAAVAAAELAYPGVPIDVRTGPIERSRLAVAPRDRLWWVWPAATVTGALALTAVAARYRRWWAIPLAPVLAHGVVTRVRRQLP